MVSLVLYKLSQHLSVIAQIFYSMVCLHMLTNNNQFIIMPVTVIFWASSTCQRKSQSSQSFPQPDLVQESSGQQFRATCSCRTDIILFLQVQSSGQQLPPLVLANLVAAPNFQGQFTFIWSSLDCCFEQHSLAGWI
jgi:hypothetical protein